MMVPLAARRRRPRVKVRPGDVFATASARSRESCCAKGSDMPRAYRLLFVLGSVERLGRMAASKRGVLMYRFVISLSTVVLASIQLIVPLSGQRGPQAPPLVK